MEIERSLKRVNPMRGRSCDVLMGAAFLIVAAAGCSSNSSSSKEAAGARAVVAPPKVTRTALEAESRDGSCEGKIVYEGEPPALEPIPRINTHENKEECLKGSPSETHRAVWIVAEKHKGVANIVVWLEPPAGKYFSLRDEDKDRRGEVVVVDQPHCAFVPRVSVLFPSYFDGTREVRTGQVFEIRNSAPFPHSVQWDPSRENDMVQQTIVPRDKKEFALNYQKKPLYMGCGQHHWMFGIIWTFDHPYHAVTRADGTFQFKNVPTGVPLTFKAWHESHGGPFEQKEMVFQKGKNPPLLLAVENTSKGAKVIGAR
jgi:hypothetical protein